MRVKMKSAGHYLLNELQQAGIKCVNFVLHELLKTAGRIIVEMCPVKLNYSMNILCYCYTEMKQSCSSYNLLFHLLCLKTAGSMEWVETSKRAPNCCTLQQLYSL